LASVERVEAQARESGSERRIERRLASRGRAPGWLDLDHLRTQPGEDQRAELGTRIREIENAVRSQHPPSPPRPPRRAAGSLPCASSRALRRPDREPRSKVEPRAGRARSRAPGDAQASSGTTASVVAALLPYAVSVLWPA